MTAGEPFGIAPSKRTEVGRTMQRDFMVSLFHTTTTTAATAAIATTATKHEDRR